MKMRKIIVLILLVMTLAFLTSCEILFQSEPTEQDTPVLQSEVDAPIETPAETSQPADDPSLTELTPKGYVITTNRIENQEGNYYIPIPDSWFNKVSYELNGTHTYIYHITTEPNQPEINPVILHINREDDISSDSAGINIFLQMNTTSFYEVSRMDAPYTQGSADDTEFRAFHDEIPQILQSVWVIDDSPWQAPTFIPPLQLGTPFTQWDAHIGTSFIGVDSKSATLAIISETPSNIDSVTWGATGEVVETYTFSFGELVFIDNILRRAVIENSSIPGPRDFHVGDHIDDVVTSFTSFVELDTANVKIFYRENTGYFDEYTCVPPAAAIFKSSGSTPNILMLSCFDESEDLTGLSTDQLIDMYTYGLVYSCYFYYGSDGIITSFRLNYIASAE